jgi:glycosyltransferase involved in cell wall biosynthesis
MQIVGDDDASAIFIPSLFQKHPRQVTTSIKIGFVLLSNAKSPIPSTRIAVLNMFPFLRAAQFDPHIVFDPVKNNETPDLTGLSAKIQADGFQIVYFQKVHGNSAVALVHELRSMGIKTVFGVCDLVDEAMAKVTDATVTVTDYLKSLYPTWLQQKIFVVHDGIEQPTLHKIDWGTNTGSRWQPLQAVLVTSVALDKLPVLINPPSWLQVTIIGRYPDADDWPRRFRETRWQFTGQPGWPARLNHLHFLANLRIKRQAWNAEHVYSAMKQADIGIIPIETQSEYGSMTGWKVKSENRLTLKMAMGLPVIATPIPAYEPVIVQGQNGFLANSKTEWLHALTALRDPTLRRTIGQQARLSALTSYSMEVQAQKLIGVLRRLIS